jgi:hypothetical protein
LPGPLLSKGAEGAKSKDYSGAEKVYRQSEQMRANNPQDQPLLYQTAQYYKQAAKQITQRLSLEPRPLKEAFRLADSARLTIALQHSDALASISLHA